MNTIPIDGSIGYHRDVKTHAVININNAEYEAYMRQRKIIEQSKLEAEESKKNLDAMSKDVEMLKKLVAQLLNKDSNGTSS